MEINVPYNIRTFHSNGIPLQQILSVLFFYIEISAKVWCTTEIQLYFSKRTFCRPSLYFNFSNDFIVP